MCLGGLPVVSGGDITGSLIVKQLWNDRNNDPSVVVPLANRFDLSKEFQIQAGWSQRRFALPGDLGSGIWDVTLHVSHLSSQEYIGGNCVLDTFGEAANMCAMDLFYNIEEPPPQDNSPPKILKIMPPVPAGNTTKRSGVTGAPLLAQQVVMDDYIAPNRSLAGLVFDIAVNVLDDNFSSSSQDGHVRLLPVTITEIGKNEKDGRVAPGCGEMLTSTSNDPWTSRPWPGATKQSSRELKVQWLPFADTNVSVHASEYGESYCALTFAAMNKYTQSTNVAQKTIEFTVGGQNKPRQSAADTSAPVLVYSLQGAGVVVVSSKTSQSSTFLQTQFSSQAGYTAIIKKLGTRHHPEHDARLTVIAQTDADDSEDASDSDERDLLQNWEALGSEPNAFTNHMDPGDAKKVTSLFTAQIVAGTTSEDVIIELTLSSVGEQGDVHVIKKTFDVQVVDDHDDPRRRRSTENSELKQLWVDALQDQQTDHTQPQILFLGSPWQTTPVTSTVKQLGTDTHYYSKVDDDWSGSLEGRISIITLAVQSLTLILVLSMGGFLMRGGGGQSRGGGGYKTLQYSD